jgi:hypothetical protein
MDLLGAVSTTLYLGEVAQKTLPFNPPGQGRRRLPGAGSSSGGLSAGWDDDPFPDGESQPPPAGGQGIGLDGQSPPGGPSGGQPPPTGPAADAGASQAWTFTLVLAGILLYLMSTKKR